MPVSPREDVPDSEASLPFVDNDMTQRDKINASGQILSSLMGISSRQNDGNNTYRIIWGSTAVTSTSSYRLGRASASSGDRDAASGGGGRQRPLATI